MAKKREHFGLKSGLAISVLLCLFIAGCARPIPQQKATSLAFTTGGIGPFRVGSPLVSVLLDLHCKGFQKISEDPLVYFCTENYAEPANALTYKLYFTKTNPVLYRIESLSPDVYFLSSPKDIFSQHKMYSSDYKADPLDVKRVSTFFDELFRGISLHNLTPSKLVFRPIPHVQNFKNKNPEDVFESDKKRVVVQQYQVLPIMPVSPTTTNPNNEVFLGGIVTHIATSHSLQFGLFYENTKEASASTGRPIGMNKSSIGNNDVILTPTQIGPFKLGMSLEQAQKACLSSAVMITHQKSTVKDFDIQELTAHFAIARYLTTNGEVGVLMTNVIDAIKNVARMVNVDPVLRCNQVEIDGSVMDFTVTFRYRQHFLRGTVPLADTISITLPYKDAAPLIKGLSLANSVDVSRGDGDAPTSAVPKDEVISALNSKLMGNFVELTKYLNFSKDTDVLYVLPGSNEFYRVGCYHKDLCGVTRTIYLADLYHQYNFPVPMPMPAGSEPPKKIVAPKVEPVPQPQAFIGPPWPISSVGSPTIDRRAIKTLKKQPRSIRRSMTRRR